VEFALIVPVFMLLVMGIIDFAMAFNDYNSLRSGVAEAARQAAVGNYSTSSCTGTSTQELVCMTEARTDLDPSRVRVRIDLPTTYTVGESVKVCAMYELESVTGMFDAVLENKAIKAETEMRLEQLDDADPLTDYTGDAAFAGSDWSWC
jgi:hypothetical protein